MDRLHEVQIYKPREEAVQSDKGRVQKPSTSTSPSFFDSVLGIFTSTTEVQEIQNAAIVEKESPENDALRRYLTLTSNLHQVLKNLQCEVDLCPNATRVICTDWSLYPTAEEKKEAAEVYLKQVRQKLADCRRLIEKFRNNQVLANTCYAYVDVAQQNFLLHRITELEKQFMALRDAFWDWYELCWEPGVKAVKEGSSYSKSSSKRR